MGVYLYTVLGLLVIALWHIFATNASWRPLVAARRVWMRLRHGPVVAAEVSQGFGPQNDTGPEYWIRLYHGPKLAKLEIWADFYPARWNHLPTP